MPHCSVFLSSALRLSPRLPKQHPKFHSAPEHHGIHVIIPAELPVLPPDPPLLRPEPAEESAPPHLRSEPPRPWHSNSDILHVKLPSPFIFSLEHKGTKNEKIQRRSALWDRWHVLDSSEGGGEGVSDSDGGRSAAVCIDVYYTAPFFMWFFSSLLIAFLSLLW